MGSPVSARLVADPTMTATLTADRQMSATLRAVPNMTATLTAGPMEEDMLRSSAPVHITGAQMLAIDVTPIELVPDPGANKTIIPVRVIVDFVAGTTVYTNNDLSVCWDANPDPLFEALAIDLNHANISGSTTAAFSMPLKAKFSTSGIAHKNLTLLAATAPTTADAGSDGDFYFTTEYTVGTTH